MYRGILTGATDGVRTDPADCKADDELNDFASALNRALRHQAAQTFKSTEAYAKFALPYIDDIECERQDGKVRIAIATRVELTLHSADVANIDEAIRTIAIVMGHFWTGIR